MVFIIDVPWFPQRNQRLIHQSSTIDLIGMQSGKNDEPKTKNEEVGQLNIIM